ncbi:hypothetical protein AOLI_G00024190 [Acnodon oligacanthus]
MCLGTCKLQQEIHQDIQQGIQTERRRKEQSSGEEPVVPGPLEGMLPGDLLPAPIEWFFCVCRASRRVTVQRSHSHSQVRLLATSSTETSLNAPERTLKHLSANLKPHVIPSLPTLIFTLHLSYCVPILQEWLTGGVPQAPLLQSLLLREFDPRSLKVKSIY